VPRRGLLVGVRGAEDSLFLEGTANELKPDGEARATEAARNGDGREPQEAPGNKKAGIARVLSLGRGSRRRRHDEGIVPAEDVLKLRR
jgi:hypothetical protein